jgi:hypothetical protein
MKSLSCLAVMVLSLSMVLPVSAQLSVGVIGGLNFADFELSGNDKMNEMEVSNMTAFGVGGVLDLGFSKSLCLHVEPMYIQKGGEVEEYNDDPEYSWTMSYVEVPIFLKYGLAMPIRPYIMAGPTIGYLLTSELEGEKEGVAYTADMEKVTEKFDYGLGFGGGVSIPVSFCNIFVEGRYSLSLQDALKKGTFVATEGSEEKPSEVAEGDEGKTKGWQVMVGVTFPL